MPYIIAAIIIILITIGTVSFFINLYNKLILLRNNVDKNFANIDVLLKQRTDEIPNLIVIAKQSMKYEENVLTKLTDLRTQFLNTKNQDEKVAVSNEITQSLRTVFAVSENYPDLKANTSLSDLQKRISEIENHIADRRELFNESVNMYNVGIHEFPNMIFSGLMGYKDKSMLIVSEQEKAYAGVRF